MDPSENPLIAPGDKKQNKKAPVKDLFGGVMKGVKDMEGMSSESDDDRLNDLDMFEKQMASANIKVTTQDMYDNHEKSYTLTIICDPEESGIEKRYQEYQKWLFDHHNDSGY